MSGLNKITYLVFLMYIRFVYADKVCYKETLRGDILKWDCCNFSFVEGQCISTDCYIFSIGSLFADGITRWLMTQEEDDNCDFAFGRLTCSRNNEVSLGGNELCFEISSIGCNNACEEPPDLPFQVIIAYIVTPLFIVGLLLFFVIDVIFWFKHVSYLEKGELMSHLVTLNSISVVYTISGYLCMIVSIILSIDISFGWGFLLTICLVICTIMKILTHPNVMPQSPIPWNILGTIVSLLTGCFIAVSSVSCNSSCIGYIICGIVFAFVEFLGFFHLFKSVKENEIFLLMYTYGQYFKIQNKIIFRILQSATGTGIHNGTVVTTSADIAGQKEIPYTSIVTIYFIFNIFSSIVIYILSIILLSSNLFWKSF